MELTSFQAQHSLDSSWAGTYMPLHWLLTIFGGSKLFAAKFSCLNCSTWSHLAFPSNALVGKNKNASCRNGSVCFAAATALFVLTPLRAPSACRRWCGFSGLIQSGPKKLTTCRDDDLDTIFFKVSLRQCSSSVCVGLSGVMISCFGRW